MYLLPVSDSFVCSPFVSFPQRPFVLSCQRHSMSAFSVHIPLPSQHFHILPHHIPLRDSDLLILWIGDHHCLHVPVVPRQYPNSISNGYFGPSTG